MRTRPLRSALVFGTLLAAVALGPVPGLPSVVAMDQGSAPHPSAMSFDSNAVTGDAAAARMNPRDPAMERALKHRDALVAVGVALVGLAALARRRSMIAFASERSGAAAPSPFCCRAPPLHGFST